MDADERVEIVPYHPAWPARFAEESAAIEAALGDRVVGGIHHIGSTAVPGLAAKPVIDILAGIADLEAGYACHEPLAALGYLYAPYRADEEHWFCKPSPQRRTHHLHLIPAGSRPYRARLAFRDHLRAPPDDAAAYEALKRRLAAELGHDREAYTQAKAEFVEVICERAGA